MNWAAGTDTVGMPGYLDNECGRYYKSGTQDVDGSLQEGIERPAGVNECIEPPDCHQVANEQLV
jgi:hypothetical protein